jgi:hypothetical protein
LLLLKDPFGINRTICWGLSARVELSRRREKIKDKILKWIDGTDIADKIIADRVIDDKDIVN